MSSGYSSTTSKLFSIVGQAIDRASMTAGRIGSTGPTSLREIGVSHKVGNINLAGPPKFSDLFGTGGDRTGAVTAQLNDKVDAWLAKYFPSINAGFKNVPDDWLIGVISGVKPFGIDSTVFDLVWHRARDRAARTTRSEQRTLEATFSSRGFALPAGALVGALAESEQRATDAVLDVNREQAIQDATIKKEILQSAVQIAAQLKQGILNTSAEFFKAYYSVYNLDNESARIRAQAYQAYYSALSTYYNVEVSWEELKLRSAVAKAEAGASNDRNRVAAAGNNQAAAAHAQASRGFADIAASSAAAAGTLVAQIESM